VCACETDLVQLVLAIDYGLGWAASSFAVRAARLRSTGTTRVEVSRVLLEPCFSFESSFHHGQYRVLHTLYRIEERALARAAESVHTKVIVPEEARGLRIRHPVLKNRERR